MGMLLQIHDGDDKVNSYLSLPESETVIGFSVQRCLSSARFCFQLFQFYLKELVMLCYW